MASVDGLTLCYNGAQGTHVKLLDRKSRLLTDRIFLLHQVAARVRLLMPFYIDAWVVLPDHMHCLWTLPEGDGNFPKRWQAIKTAFSR